MISQYTVGHRFPKANPNGGMDCNLVDINQTGFDLLLYLNQVSDYEKREIRKVQLLYGCFEKDGIPFFLLWFPNAELQLDFSMNLLKVKNSADINSILNSKSNVITLLLIDAKSNELLVMRTISMRQELSERIRSILQNQITIYDSADQVNRKITQVNSKTSLENMISATDMYQLNF